MAKTPISTVPLSFVEIVMRADAETIRAALEAKIKVDDLLARREAAYREIAALEGQIEEVIGEQGVFVFPEPPLPVAGFASKAASPVVKKPAVQKTDAPKTATGEEKPSKS